MSTVKVCGIDNTLLSESLYCDNVVMVDKHLENYISTNIADRLVIDNIYDLYWRSNWVISDFRVCDSSTLDNLYRTYCMHMYGSEFWGLNCNYVKDF